APTFWDTELAEYSTVALAGLLVFMLLAVALRPRRETVGERLAEYQMATRGPVEESVFLDDLLDRVVLPARHRGGRTRARSAGHAAARDADRAARRPGRPARRRARAAAEGSSPGRRVLGAAAGQPRGALPVAAGRLRAPAGPRRRGRQRGRAVAQGVPPRHDAGQARRADRGRAGGARRADAVEGARLGGGRGRHPEPRRRQHGRDLRQRRRRDPGPAAAAPPGEGADRTGPHDAGRADEPPGRGRRDALHHQSRLHEHDARAAGRRGRSAVRRVPEPARFLDHLPHRQHRDL
ncbi:MAG: hypothetical protein AVDCRST_MAG79-1868, partial [uncultured Thermoleophilia bacterium]